MKRSKLVCLSLSLLVSIGLLAGCGGEKKEAGKASETVLKIGHVEPEDRSTHKALLNFKKKVEERSKGSLKIEIYPNGALGGDVQLSEAVATGSLDMALPSTSVLTTYNDEFGVLDMPYLFKSSEAAFKALDGDVGKELNGKIASKGIDILGYSYNGPRSTTSKVKPIVTPEDLKGLKMRVMESPIFIDFYKTLGANPTPMSFTELYTGLQQGTVEAQENPPSLTFANKFYEVQKYSTIDEHVHNFLAFLIFYRSREIKNQYFETAFVPHGDKDSILGSSPATLHLKEEIERVAPSSSTVLITGESGTGKEMVATSIWREGSRKEGRFIALNCAAIPENLMESELFGYVKGAFTGADPNGRMGKFELANGGVIFLDEIGDMPLYLQSKLLRVLQERQIVCIGSNQLVDIDVRVIAATNKDLKKMVEEKQFREDLYYRLNVIPIHIEPLRNRKEDIEELSVHYIRRFSSLLGKSEPRITEDLMETLKRYPWPGNVRELENVMEYMVNLAVPGGDLDVDLLPKEMRKTPNQDAHVAASDLGIEAPIVPLVELEEAAIRRALLRYGRSGEGKLKAAQALGLSKATLYRKIKEYGV